MRRVVQLGGCKTVPRRQWCAHLVADAASHLHTTGREPRAQKSVTGQCAHVTAFERCDRRHKSAVRQASFFGRRSFLLLHPKNDGVARDAHPHLGVDFSTLGTSPLISPEKHPHK